jgi:hypothetical protein
MFKIIGADGNEYGPVTAEILKQWISQSRVNGQTKILAEGTTEWKTVAEFPELAAALPLTPPPMATDLSAMPGGSPLPTDVGERDYDLDIGACVSRAWQLLTGPRMWPVIGGVAIWIGIQAGLSAFAQIPFVGMLFSLANFVIGGPLIGGIYYFLLRCIRGEATDVGDVFAGFKYRFGQLFVGQLVVTLLTLAIMLPGLGLIVAGLIPLFKHHDVAPAGIALIGVGGIVMLIPLLYFSVSWMFTLPLIMDKRLDFWPAMQLSRRVVGRHWWTTFALSIVIGLIGVAGLILCCVGGFFTFPLAFAALMNAYESMFSLIPGAPASTATPTIPQTQS